MSEKARRRWSWRQGGGKAPERGQRALPLRQPRRVSTQRRLAWGYVEERQPWTSTLLLGSPCYPQFSGDIGNRKQDHLALHRLPELKRAGAHHPFKDGALSQRGLRHPRFPGLAVGLGRNLRRAHLMRASGPQASPVLGLGVEQLRGFISFPLVPGVILKALRASSGGHQERISCQHFCI